MIGIFETYPYRTTPDMPRLPKPTPTERFRPRERLVGVGFAAKSVVLKTDFSNNTVFSIIGPKMNLGSTPTPTTPSFPKHQYWKPAKIFTGLANAFPVLGALWKPHKNLSRSILHGRNIHETFPTPKIYVLFLDRNFWFRKKMLEKNLKFFRKIEDFSEISGKFSDFFQHFFFETKIFDRDKINYFLE